MIEDCLLYLRCCDYYLTFSQTYFSMIIVNVHFIIMHNSQVPSSYHHFHYKPNLWVKPHFYQSFLFDSTPFPHLTPPTAAHRLNILIKFFGPGGKPATLYKTMYKFTKYLGLCSSKWMPSIAPGNEPNSVHTINWPESDTQLKISAWVSPRDQKIL